jgi:hypothetical protein
MMGVAIVTQKGFGSLVLVVVDANKMFTTMTMD